MIIEKNTLLEHIRNMSPEGLSNWVNKLVPRNRFAIEDCLRGLARDHNRRVDLLNQHIGFAVRERATLQQLGSVLFRDEPEPDEDPARTRIRENPQLRQAYERIMAAGYENEVEFLAQANMNPEAGNQVFSIIMAKHNYFKAPPSSQPQLRMQLPNAVQQQPTEIVDLCSDSEDDDGDGGPRGQGDEHEPNYGKTMGAKRQLSSSPIMCSDDDDNDGATAAATPDGQERGAKRNRLM